MPLTLKVGLYYIKYQFKGQVYHLKLPLRHYFLLEAAPPPKRMVAILVGLTLFVTLIECCLCVFDPKDVALSSKC